MKKEITSKDKQIQQITLEADKLKNQTLANKQNENKRIKRKSRKTYY